MLSSETSDSRTARLDRHRPVRTSRRPVGRSVRGRRQRDAGPSTALRHPLRPADPRLSDRRSRTRPPSAAESGNARTSGWWFPLRLSAL